MASKAHDAKGWRIQFVEARKRRTVRLPDATEAGADELLVLVEALHRAMKNGELIPSKVAREVAGLPDRIHAKLAVVGLLEPASRRSERPLARCSSRSWTRLM